MSIVNKIRNGLRFRYKYLSFFGPLRVIQIQLAKLLKKDYITIHLPGYAHPIFIRPGTTDAKTFLKIFKDVEYGLPYPDSEVSFIIDGGSNAGYSTLYFAHRFPNAKIISVEAEASNYELVVKNTRLYPNIIPLHAALWHRNAMLKIDNPNAGKWAFRVSEADQERTSMVKAVTIDELLESYQGQEISILKLDIEGAEKELFESGYERWLNQVEVLVIELHEWMRPGCRAAFFGATDPYAPKQLKKGENLMLTFTHDAPVSHQMNDAEVETVSVS